MISIKLYQKDDSLVGFDADGHAGYADEGEDIYCAAVSALVINTINSIEKFTNDIFTENTDDESMVSFRISGRPSGDCQLLMKSLVNGLAEIADNHKKYLRLEFEEV